MIMVGRNMIKEQLVLLMFAMSITGSPPRQWLFPTGYLDDGGRSGGFPKFPVTTKSIQCGTRAVPHQPHRNPSPKIIGGTNAPYGAYPWQVELKAFKGGKWEHHCGGAVVGERLVLTAAHCLASLDSTSQIRILVGKHNLYARDKHERAYKPERIITHPDFRKAGPHSNDIALIKVKAVNDAGINFNSYVQPICLPDNSHETPREGDWCIVTGWGAQKAEDSETLSSELRAAWVPVLSQSTCRKQDVYGGRLQSILDSMLCAGHLDGGIDACRGDSGGPLACQVNGRFVIGGVVSWGDGCAKKNRPGVYTRVSHYIPWIQQTARSLGVQA